MKVIDNCNLAQKKYRPIEHDKSKLMKIIKHEALTHGEDTFN